MFINIIWGDKMATDFAKTVGLARSGDTEAFATLYSDVYKDLYHMALYNLKDANDAEDVVSETVLDAFATIGNLRDENAFRSWITTILYAKIKRKLKEYAVCGIVFTYEVEHQKLNYDGIDLKQELNRLLDDERLILSLSIIGGYTSKEIGKMLDMKPSTVRSKLLRTKMKLRERLS